MIRLDNRGLNCPEPVIRTKQALAQLDSGVLVSIVDNVIARENVCRLAKSLGLAAEINSINEAEIHIIITKGSGQAEVLQSVTPLADFVVLVKGDVLGTGNETLGQALMKSLFFTIRESTPPPGTLLFLNSGVKLTCQGSPVVAHLEELSRQGVEILSCGTCLDFYDLKDKLAVGEVTNMYVIWERVQAAQKAITL